MLRVPAGWRRYVRATVAFAVAVVVFDRLFFAALERLSARVERTSAMEQKLSGLENRAAYQWLILGTSRTFEAIHPAVISRELGVKAFKEASKGKGLRYGYEFYRLYKRLVGTPRLLIYGVDYFMFGMETEAPLMRRFGVARPDGLRATAVWPPLRMAANKAANERAIVRILERLQWQFVASMGEFDPDNKVRDMESYTGNPVSKVVERPEPVGFDRVQYARYPGLEGEYFTRLVQEWNADGVVVVLVYPPDYIATERTNFEHGAFIAAVRQLVGGCPKCVVLDYDDPVRFPTSTPAYFRDGDYGSPNSHLSKSGVEQLNRVWLPDLKRVADQFGVPTIPFAGR